MIAFGLADTHKGSQRSRWFGFCRIALASVMVTLPLAAQGQKVSGKSKSIGFILSGEATAQEVGLPIYPGARSQKDNSDDSSALQLGLWGGSSGFKLVVLKLESDDSPKKVAAFYRRALGKYGAVLDCTGEAVKWSDQSKNSSNQLECDADQPEKGGFALKAGSKQRQHAVGIQANGSHSRFQLVYVETPKSD
jgi:hypothetical protein